MMIHKLKTEPWSYTAVAHGDKTFEVRYNDDRGFQKGDTVILQLFDKGCYDT